MAILLPGRVYEPINELLTLIDYRTRLSQYHLDHDLRYLHQQYPFITVWDDHETANNSWYGGAQNHTPGVEGDWFDRKGSAIQAYFEWLPIRYPDPNDSERIYRKFNFGDLLDLYMLDTRLIGRDLQVGTTSPLLTDSSRSLLGAQQYSWLVNNMDSSTAQWQVLGQQVMMAPLKSSGTIVNDDQWDGYPIERQILINDLLNKSVNNIVVLTGDIHTSWGNDLPFNPGIPYNPSTGAGSVGVEFVTTSITSPGLPVPVPVSLVKFNNPSVKYVDLIQKGYLILDIDKTRTQADWYYVPTVTQVQYVDAYAESWYVNDLDGYLKGTTTPSPSPSTLPVQPPLLPKNPVVGLNETEVNEVVLFGAYPNPFTDLLLVNYFVYNESEVKISLIDITGKTVISKNPRTLKKGLYDENIHTGPLSSGSYILLIETPSQVLKRKIVKN